MGCTSQFLKNCLGTVLNVQILFPQLRLEPEIMISTSSWGMPTQQDERIQSEETMKTIRPIPPDFIDEERKAQGVSETTVTLKVKVKSLSHVQLFVTPRAVAYQVLHPWDFPGKNAGVGCHFLLQGIFPTQGLNPGLSHWRQTLYRKPAHLKYNVVNSMAVIC